MDGQFSQQPGGSIKTGPAKLLIGCFNFACDVPLLRQ
jgi:hypothetical protein